MAADLCVQPLDPVTYCQYRQRSTWQQTVLALVT